LVTIEYSVPPEKLSEFITAIYKHERLRRRDGAYHWGVFRDLEQPDRYLEIFLVNSWAEHLRQHERSTGADRALEEQVEGYIRGKSTVRHLVAAER
jgi:hypothetical protein